VKGDGASEHPIKPDQTRYKSAQTGSKSAPIRGTLVTGLKEPRLESWRRFRKRAIQWASQRGKKQQCLRGGVLATILVVDDSAVDRKLAVEFLSENRHWSLCEVDNGASALELMDDHPVDLVVTDLIMAPMNGLGLIQQVLQHHPTVPVIIMTSLSNDTLAVQALRLGAASYVAKRRLAADLKETVEHVLALRTSRAREFDAKSLITRAETVFVLDNDVEQIQSLIGHLQESITRPSTGGKQRMARISFSEAERLRINMALHEAMLNAYRHGNLEVNSTLDNDAAMDVCNVRRHEPPYKFRNIVVETRLTATEATYVIRDEGQGFDASAHLLSEDDSLDDRPGRGIALMQMIMDELHYNNKGNEVTLIKRLC
jgi:CheY-like chemotaxis protein/anti-sigma regulatory factor (Ser/Thr protein kinase)